jgi:hypothetical protein
MHMNGSIGLKVDRLKRSSLKISERAGLGLLVPAGETSSHYIFTRNNVTDSYLFESRV